MDNFEKVKKDFDAFNALALEEAAYLEYMKHMNSYIDRQAEKLATKLQKNFGDSRFATRTKVSINITITEKL